jgi:hypothetical protein
MAAAAPASAPPMNANNPLHFITNKYMEIFFYFCQLSNTFEIYIVQRILKKWEKEFLP